MPSNITNFINLSYADVTAIIGSDRRNEDNYKQYYIDDGKTGYTINFRQVKFVESSHIVTVLDNARITFDNCIFEEITFSSVTIENLNFYHCAFRKVSAYNCRIPTFIYENSERIQGNIELINNTVDSFDFQGDFDNLIFENLEQTQGTTINNSFNVRSNVNKVKINNCNSSNFKPSFLGRIEHMSITNSNFQGNLSKAKVSSLDILSSLIFELSGCYHSIRIDHCHTKMLSFINLICLEEIFITDISKIDVKYIQDVGIYFTNVFVGGILKLDGIKVPIIIQNEFDAKFTLIKKLLVEDHHDSIYIRGLNSQKPVIINELLLNEVQIQQTNSFKLQHLRICELKFKNFVNRSDGNIDNVSENLSAFRTLKLNDLSILDFFDDIQNITQKSLPKATVKYKLQLIESDFGKMNFINSDFSNFELIFDSSKIIDVFLAGSQLPIIVNSNRENKYARYQQQRIANSQLKKLHDQQGDSVGSALYYSNEMNGYYESIKFFKSPYEKINLWLNKWSSNHGFSWARGLASTLIVSSAFYLIFCLSIGYTIASHVDYATINTFNKVFSYYFEFINPVHRIDSFKDIAPNKSVSSLARIIDGVSRIFISYFIYQLIQAFRKHGRSK
jgi:hypothetical protein